MATEQVPKRAAKTKSIRKTPRPSSNNENELLVKNPNLVQPRLPLWGAEKEIGYVIAAGAHEAVKIGADADLVTTLIPSKFKKGLRLGDPLIVYDYVEGECFGGLITEIACPNMMMEHLETYLFEKFVPTQTLIDNNRLDFLEQGVLVSIQLF
ncbi:MAG: hypothetical protein ACW976_06960, partial [Candidatus Ranarchaeia archaeon]